MLTPEIFTHRNHKTYEDPHFFILNKGNNSGKPLQKPCPNCFVIIFDDNAIKDQFYWLLYGLWRSRTFHPFLRGSVIPFIVKKDLLTCIREAHVKTIERPDLFQNSVDALCKLEDLEKQYKEKLKLIDDAKRFLFSRYAKSR